MVKTLKYFVYSKTFYEQPPLWAANLQMGGHLVIPKNDILYTNAPAMGSHLP